MTEYRGDWEKTHGLDAINSDDGSLMTNGYTNLDRYLSSLVSPPE